MKNKINLPSKTEMNIEIEKHRVKLANRFKKSDRHTIQEDPLRYNDEISNFYGARPSFIKNFTLIGR